MMRDDDAPCNIDDIAIWGLHDYFCDEATWRAQYTPVTGEVITGLIADLEALATENGYSYDWTTYVQARDFWLTETHCRWNKGSALINPTAEESCQ